MKCIRQTTSSTAIIAAMLCATTASADVTAQQVWDNWTSQVTAYGQGFTTGDETMSNGTLTISDVAINISDDEADVNAQLGDVMLTENDDGTVTITMAESYPITLNLTPEFGDPSVVNITVSQSGMNLVVSGDAEEMTYDINADRYAISIDNLEGDAASEINLTDAVIAVIDLSGQYSVKSDDLTRISYAFDLGALDIDVLFNEANGEGLVSANGDITDLKMFAEIATPVDMDMEADAPPFDQGLAMEGGYSFGMLEYAFDVDADGEVVSGTMSVDDGGLAFAIDLDGASYTGTTNSIDVSMLVANQLPFPIEVSLEKYGFDFQIPLSMGDDGPRDARLAFDLTDLKISDVLWDLADPQNILPRDAATIAIGLDAKVTPFFNFLDPAQQEAAGMAMIPGELNAVDITEFTLRAAGAEITGGGAFIFDNTDLTSFDGMPRPEGQMSFAINGANGLIDSLIQMGLIPEEEAMMPRMMMGMFTTPVGDDMLTSTIEVNSDGHVLANGQRLR